MRALFLPLQIDQIFEPCFKNCNEKMQAVFSFLISTVYKYCRINDAAIKSGNGVCNVSTSCCYSAYFGECDPQQSISIL